MNDSIIDAMQAIINERAYMLELLTSFVFRTCYDSTTHELDSAADADAAGALRLLAKHGLVAITSDDNQRRVKAVPPTHTPIFGVTTP